MAMALIVWRRRIGETLRNMGRILAALITFRVPDSELSLDNPQAAKVPFGVAVTVATMAFAVQQIWGWLK
jgi:hypothetical protein